MGDPHNTLIVIALVVAVLTLIVFIGQRQQRKDNHRFGGEQRD